MNLIISIKQNSSNKFALMFNKKKLILIILLVSKNNKISMIMSNSLLILKLYLMKNLKLNFNKSVVIKLKKVSFNLKIDLIQF